MNGSIRFIEMSRSMTNNRWDRTHADLGLYMIRARLFGCFASVVVEDTESTNG